MSCSDQTRSGQDQVNVFSDQVKSYISGQVCSGQFKSRSNQDRVKDRSR